MEAVAERPNASACKAENPSVQLRPASPIGIIMDRLDVVLRIKKLIEEEFDSDYVDFTFICRCDAAINDIEHGKYKDIVDLLRFMSYNHRRVFNMLHLTERN